MNSFNPMNLMNMMMQNQQKSIPTQQSAPPFNINQMRQFMPQINDTMLQQLVNKARAQGISDADIEVGLQILRNL